MKNTKRRPGMTLRPTSARRYPIRLGTQATNPDWGKPWGVATSERFVGQALQAVGYVSTCQRAPPCPTCLRLSCEVVPPGCC
jgi:hypothetical protein